MTADEVGKNPRVRESPVLLPLPPGEGWGEGNGTYAATPLFGFNKNFSPVACFPYTPIASSCKASSNETSRV